MGAVGTILYERYEIIAEIGKGGMSTVYMAKDRNLGSYWAVKQVKNERNVDIEAFKKEVELLSSLNHSDIPRIVDRIELNDDYFVIMDLVNGTSLGKKVAVEGPQPEKQVIEWAKMLCDVLHYLHTIKENPIIYRDMKPDNVMLTESGRIKLIDFGIAKECRRGEKQSGAAIGSKGYAAPEQYRGASNLLDERTDIYSLGATLYNLVTGMAPEKPPKGIRPIRQINPVLSEGLEYIITKCTDDDPDERYQDCAELRNDLDNIDQLNFKYRRTMRNKLALFCASFGLCILCACLALVGFNGIQQDKEDKYQVAYLAAQNFEKQNKTTDAQNEYATAIKNKPALLETYQKLFSLLLPKSGDKDYLTKTKFAVDTLRAYVEDQSSPMYRNGELLYQLVKQCVNVNDPAYAAYAADYITAIKTSDAYKSGKLNKSDIESYEVIASNCAKNITTQNFTEFSTALAKLEDNTDKSNYSVNDKLNNYYTMIVIYNTYPENLKDAYTKTAEIGVKAKKLIDTNAQSELLTFNNIIPMYELIASSMYNNAVVATDVTVKRQTFQSSLQWFGYLNDLNDDLSETLMLKKGNAYKGIFDTYNTVEGRAQIDKTITGNLNSAIQIYADVFQKNPDSFLGAVNLAQAHLDAELIKPAQQRNFVTVQSDYKKITEIKNKNKNLSSISLSQFSSLKQQMANAGLEA